MRMKKQKVVKPDGRWMYLYTFEEDLERSPESEEQQPAETQRGHPVQKRVGKSC